MSETVQIGVIGGSGLYSMPEIEDIHSIEVDTPFGKPSGNIILGTLRGRRVAFLPRHGVGHRHTPSAIPQRANIYALKSLGVRFIIAVNACGSLREDYAPGHVVIPDQLFDYTLDRGERSFFGSGLVAHISTADPFDEALRQQLIASSAACGGTVHSKGTFIIEDGPRFATRAESHIFRAWGCDIIGMTTAPEAFLAREAEIAYATMAHITDYDSWHESEAPVTVDMVVATFNRNIQLAQQVIAHVVEHLNINQTTPSHRALDGAIMTGRDALDPAVMDALRPIVARALGL